MRILFVTFFIVLADQITKFRVKGISIPSLGINIEGIPYQSSIPVFGDWFKITFIENPGMAFGLQIGGKLFLSIFTIIATILLFYFLYKNKNSVFLLRLSLALILAGALGNLIDRLFYGEIYGYAPIFYGRVVDFLHIDFPDIVILGKRISSWPIFNIADISVTIGFLLILFGYKKIFKEEEVIVFDPDSLTLFSDDSFISEKESELDKNDFEMPENSSSEKETSENNEGFQRNENISSILKNE